jgi:hypothetical protein
MRGQQRGPEEVLFGNDSHGIARNPNISTFTDVNDRHVHGRLR